MKKKGKVITCDENENIKNMREGGGLEVRGMLFEIRIGR